MEVYDSSPAIAQNPTPALQNCVDMASNRTQYLGVVTLPLLEMGNGLNSDPAIRLAREKQSRRNFMPAKKKAAKKKKKH
jgi:hypothetical protein